MWIIKVDITKKQTHFNQFLQERVVGGVGMVPLVLILSTTNTEILVHSQSLADPGEGV